MRRVQHQHRNSTVHRLYDRRALRQLGVLFGCCLVLAGGFVQAASQRFAAVRYGYQSEVLRRESARLAEEQRRLLLTIERAATPSRLERAAREIGMRRADASQIVPSTSSFNRRDNNRSGGRTQTPPSTSTSAEVHTAGRGL